MGNINSYSLAGCNPFFQLINGEEISAYTRHLHFPPNESSIHQKSIAVLKGINHTTGRQITIYINKSRVIRIGRLRDKYDDELQQVILQDPCVSGTHLFIWCIQFDDNVKPITYLQNFSMNGTYINKGQVKLHDFGELYVLQDGDLIEVVKGMTAEFRYTSLKNVLQTDQKGFDKEIGNWEITNHLIGFGNFGEVKICRKIGKRSQNLYAVKLISPKNNSEIKMANNEIQSISSESSLLMKLNHPNIIRILESFINKEKQIFIFQELAIGGDLFLYLTKGESFHLQLDEIESMILTYQIVRGLKYLHEHQIVHRDLKLDNILIMGIPKKNPRIVIADFGIAKEKNTKFTGDSQITAKRGQTRMFTTVGTAEYCAPEVGMYENRGKGYGSKCDVWSLGIISHLMLSGISPFYSTDVNRMSEKAFLGELHLNNSNWSGVSDEAKEFMRCCINVSYETRYSIEDCLYKSAWFNKSKTRQEWLRRIYQDIVSGCDTAACGSARNQRPDRATGEMRDLG